MPETKTIGTIKIITDSETSYDNIGDVDGGFSDIDLLKHIEKHGHDGLCRELTYMNWQVWQAVRDINAGKHKDNDCVASN